MADNIQKFFDEVINKLARIYFRRYPNVLYPGMPSFEVKTSTKDVEWLELAGRWNWVCITKDIDILHDPGERKALFYNGVRLIDLMDVSQEKTFTLERMVNYVWNDIPEWFYRYEPPWVVQVFLTEWGIYHRIMSGPELRKEWNLP